MLRVRVCLQSVASPVARRADTSADSPAVRPSPCPVRCILLMQRGSFVLRRRRLTALFAVWRAAARAQTGGGQEEDKERKNEKEGKASEKVHRFTLNWG